MRIAIVMAVAVLLGVAPLLGCAHETRTVTTTETVECPSVETYEEELDRECIESRTQVTVVEEREESCHGAISCSFTLVGQLISLPFQIVGGVLGAVF
jgi:hypothetical protein